MWGHLGIGILRPLRKRKLAIRYDWSECGRNFHAFSSGNGRLTWFLRWAFGTPSIFVNAGWPWYNFRSSDIVRFVLGGVVKTFR